MTEDTAVYVTLPEEDPARITSSSSWSGSASSVKPVAAKLGAANPAATKLVAVKTPAAKLAAAKPATAAAAAKSKSKLEPAVHRQLTVAEAFPNSRNRSHIVEDVDTDEEDDHPQKRTMPRKHNNMP